MKFYGTMLCPHCKAAKEKMDAEGISYEFFNIFESTANMREFLALRDNREEFKPAKEKGRIGIPCFLYEDGRLEFIEHD